MRVSHFSRSFGRALVLAISLITATVAGSSQAQADQVTALVPAYFYPTWWLPTGSPWNQLNAAAATIPIEAIMNPASGPGAAFNPDYGVAVTELQAAGGKVIGYVPTSYGARAIEDVMADVQSYITWYNVDGIFLDEMAIQPGGLDYVALYNQIKGLRATLHVVGNPGEPFIQGDAYLLAADTLNIFEGPLTNSDPTQASFKLYPNRGPYTGLPLWFENVNRSQIANIVFGAKSDLVADLALLKAVVLNAGYVYVTDEVLPNPYAGLPAYWAEEVKLIALINSLLGCE
jgi:Spherulation-specific family 4